MDGEVSVQEAGQELIPARRMGSSHVERMRDSLPGPTEGGEAW